MRALDFKANRISLCLQEGPISSTVRLPLPPLPPTVWIKWSRVIPYADMFDVTKAQLLRNWEGWSQISSSCVWMGFFLLLNLVFIGTTSVNSLLKNVSISSKKKNVTLNEEQQQCPTTKYQRGNITLGISYQVSKLCCLIVLVSHLVRQSLLLLQEYRRNCNYMLSVLAEVTQVVSWIVMSVAVLSFHKATSVKLPCVIRIWWISCFFQSVISIKYKVQSIIRHEDLIGAEEYTTLLSLLSCGYLSAVSFRGTTGISFTRSTATEPLLHASLNKQEEKESQSLYGEASLQQLVTFSWLSPLFVLGKRKPLDQSDVPDIDIKETAEFSSNLFDNDLKHVKEIYNSSQNMSIYITIFIFIRKKVAVNACFALLCASASFVGPSLIYNFVEFLNGRDHGLKTGYLLALAFVSAKFVETISHGQWAFRARLLGLRLKAALISHIYKKGLHLSNQSRRYHSSGEIINYMSVDIERVIKVIWHANILLKLPVQISLAIYVLHKNLGLGSIAGLAATLMVITCNIPITRTQKRFQSKIMESKDARMKATSEVLRNMRILKLQAWDTQYLNKLETLRNVEYGWLWKSLKLQALSALVFWGAPTFISVVTFGACILMGIPLTAGRVLSALATFQMLQDPIFSLPELLRVMAEAKVSTDRLAAYLQEEEMKSDAVEIIPRNETRLDIEIDDGIFSWDGDNESPTLTDVQLNVQKGMKVAICGTTGSGKSSLVSSILGEIPKVGGRVKVCGSKAYVAQTPWILSGNVRENILFGNQYDSERYERIIEACALIEDFELFPSGDLTEIGERGINMSGGQKQRIQIARAVYQDADVYLLDDPFSAVDAHTGTHLFKECLMGILKDKTILYVTHQVEFLPAADLILVMQNGKIAQAGKYDELLSQNIGFEVLVGAHNEALESILSAESSSRALPKDEQRIRETSNESERKTEKIVDPQSQSINKQESQKCTSEDIANRGKLTKDEERERGSISKTVYWAYLTAVHHGVFVPIIIIAQCLFQILQVSSNYWMTWASPATSASEPIIGMTVLFSVYILLSVGSSLCVFARAILVVTAGLLTSQKVFKDMLRCLIRAPMSFFDSTPTGRILNRASTDQSVLDLDIAGNLGSFALSLTGITGTIIVMSQVAWPIFVLFVLVAAISIWYQRYYIATSRELSRLSGIQRAPILHHFAESLSGAATIRAFGQEDRFINANLSLIDNHSKPRLHYVTAMEWLSLRINVLSLFVFAFSLILLVSLPEGFINPSIAGLAVTYGLNLSSQLASIIWSMSDTENQMISVERILQYSRIQNEAPLLIEKCRPPNHWPEIGTINFKNLQVRYAEHLPSVLQNITCTIPGGKKVGVVGRTGSGKSTLIQALFRIVEPREGTIEIDGVDICKIGLHDLRSRLSIIPQDPTMFEGTVRGNLDPLKEYSDQRIWEVLEKCQLSELIQQNEKKLDLPVAENGENWSVGQRQLFCLGRALLKRSSILVLDEATASLDSATDEIIQKTIRQEFEYCTVVTIAHRIHTVIDSNLILVLSEGRVHEYDTPAKLLEREDSAFSKLIKEYSMRSHYSLTNI